MGGIIPKPIKKAYHDARGITQKRKSRERTGWAQNAYNEAGRLKQEYSSSVEPQIQQIENALKAAVHQRHQYGGQLSAYQANAQGLAHNISHSERMLAQAGQNLQHKTAEYEANIARHQGEISEFNKKGASLQQLVDIFKTDAPELAHQIEEYKKMPQDFFERVEAQKAKKAQLAGFSRDEIGDAAFTDYEEGVKDLKIKRADLEEAITAKYQGLSEQHKALLGRRQDLMSKLGSYEKEQDKLLARSEHYNRERSHLENIISSYRSDEARHNTELDRARQLQSAYESRHRDYLANEANIEKLVKDATHYQGVSDQYRGSIEHQLSEAEKFERDAAFHAKKAKRDAMRFAIGTAAIGGLAGGFGLLGAPGVAASTGVPAVAGTGLVGTLGISSTLGAAGLGAGLGGIAGLLHAKNTLKKFPTLSVPDTHIDTEFYRNFQNAISGGVGNATYLGQNAPISSGMLGNSPKINITALGGWQDPKHFGLQQMPKPHEMPSLDSALGRVKDPKELNDLTLGLPKSTSREGKSYNYGILLDPFFNKNFKKVMKKAARYGRFGTGNRNPGTLQLI
jgi:uncharacterized protein YeeX (DUF496 family)